MAQRYARRVRRAVRHEAQARGAAGLHQRAPRSSAASSSEAARSRPPASPETIEGAIVIAIAMIASTIIISMIVKPASARRRARG
jgi:hypothetical protein